MSDLALTAELFHFLRPWLLVLLPLIGLIWWSVRRRARRASPSHANIAPHLAQAMMVGTTGAAASSPSMWWRPC